MRVTKEEIIQEVPKQVHTKRALIPFFIVTLGFLGFMGYAVSHATTEFIDPGCKPPGCQPGVPVLPANTPTPSLLEVLTKGSNASTFLGDTLLGGKLIAPTLQTNNLCIGGVCKNSWASIAGVIPTLQQVTTAGATTTNNVGIGTTTPLTKLHVDVNSASAGTDALSIANRGVTTVGHTTGLRFQYNTAVPSAIRAILENGASGAARLGFFVSTDGTPSGLTEYVSVKSNGNVGIGTATPAAKLDVNGTIRIGGGTPGAGKVLTSDPNGLASWQTPSSSAGNTVYMRFTPPSYLYSVDRVATCNTNFGPSYTPATGQETALYAGGVALGMFWAKESYGSNPHYIFADTNGALGLRTTFTNSYESMASIPCIRN